MLIFSLFGRTFSWKQALLALGVGVVAASGIVMLRDMQNPVAENPKDATYLLEGKRISLTGENSYFGNTATGDLNGDGVNDVAFLFVSQPGGSGSFYYVAVALGVKGGYRGTNAVLLGDRIAPQTTVIQDGQLIVNYADRRTGEPFTARPSMGVSKYLRIVDGVLTEVR